MTEQVALLTVRQLTEQVGYQNEESIRRRIRQLRRAGLVRDRGNTPSFYPVIEKEDFEGLTLFWVHRNTYLIEPGFPRQLFPGRSENGS